MPFTIFVHDDPSQKQKLTRLSAEYISHKTRIEMFKSGQDNAFRTIDLSKVNIDISRIGKTPKMFETKIDNETIYFERLEELKYMLNQLKNNIGDAEYAKKLSIPISNQVIPDYLVREARENNAPEYQLEIVDESSQEEDDAEEENLEDIDKELLEKFMQTQQDALFIVRNLHIVEVPIKDKYDLNLSKQYVYINVMAGDNLEIQVISAVDFRPNARDFLFATVSSQQLCAKQAKLFKQTQVKQKNIEEFHPIDNESEFDIEQPVENVAQSILTSSAYVFKKLNLDVKRKKHRPSKLLTVTHIYNGSVERLCLESFVMLPFFDFDNPQPQITNQREIVYKGIYIFNLNNHYAIQFSASHDFKFATQEFKLVFQTPKIKDRALAMYFLDQLDVIERRTIVVNELDLSAVRKVCKGNKNKFNLSHLNQQQQILVEAYLSARDSLIKKNLFDTNQQLLGLEEDEFADFLQPMPKPKYIMIENGAPVQKATCNYYDLDEKSGCFVMLEGYLVYNFIGRKCSSKIKQFCAMQSRKFDAEIIYQDTERSDFQCLFADYGKMSPAQLKDMRERAMEKVRQVREEIPYTIKLEFQTYARPAPVPAPAKYTLKYHVATDQQNKNRDVLDGYNYEENGQRVLNLCSSMAQMLTFHCPEIPKPFRVFVWKGQHCQNSQVFCQGSQFWIGEIGQKLYSQKLLKTQTEEQFDESPDFLSYFDCIVYHLGQFSKFQAMKKSWELGCLQQINKRDHIRVFKVYEHFNSAGKICFQEQVIFSQFNEVQMDPTTCVIVLDYKEEQMYVKYGRKCNDLIINYVKANALNALSVKTFKTNLYDDFKAKLLKYVKIAELPFKQESTGKDLDCWRISVNQQQINLRYTFNLQDVNKTSQLYLLRHGCLSRMYLVIPMDHMEDFMLQNTIKELKAMGVEFGLIDFRNQKLLIENLLTLQALLPSFVGMNMRYKDEFLTENSPGYFYSCCSHFHRLQMELLMKDCQQMGKPTIEFNAVRQKVFTNFYRNIENTLLNEYNMKYNKNKKTDKKLTQVQLMIQQKMEQKVIKQDNIALDISVGVPDLFEDE
ncbi:Conserved_hypothetical protein [Hexamita inflata]|uniref:Uncharacterized protein n=1 Tax=Hexamita inflata TaxID=28002 RepID=A0AA86Q998_9EUKA|nr:Conserved hypothetical protein [Hexamita inflata]